MLFATLNVRNCAYFFDFFVITLYKERREDIIAADHKCSLT